jgi:hypothetical protein
MKATIVAEIGSATTCISMHACNTLLLLLEAKGKRAVGCIHVKEGLEFGVHE